ncbi:endogenous retrovirus group K member 25 Pro protein-like [Macrotis lagotis]|uniref:endogenous retrovirus group K member 25 Pro protein-like n=1 Tax=Macrotis lagotis TaxID=92651 RepID=UPI003D689BC4
MGQPSAPHLRGNDILWTAPIQPGQLRMSLKLPGSVWTGVIDTGADITVIPADQAPSEWPTEKGPTIMGVCGETSTQLLSRDLRWEDWEVHSGSIRPLLVPGAPHVIWGRDLQKHMGLHISTDVSTGHPQF